MTPHSHRTPVDGCFRCDLSAAEVAVTPGRATLGAPGGRPLTAADLGALRAASSLARELAGSERKEGVHENAV